MADLIGRKAAMDVFMGKPPGYYHTSYIVGELNSLPSVDAEPVKRGRWTEEDCCSECGQYVYHGDMRNFCPRCGAKNAEARP